MRPVNRAEAGGAPAIGIEARKGRDPARRGSVRSTRARPEGIAPILPGEAVRGSPVGYREGRVADVKRESFDECLRDL